MLPVNRSMGHVPDPNNIILFPKSRIKFDECQMNLYVQDVSLYVDCCLPNERMK